MMKLPRGDFFQTWRMEWVQGDTLTPNHILHKGTLQHHLHHIHHMCILQRQLHILLKTTTLQHLEHTLPMPILHMDTRLMRTLHQGTSPMEHILQLAIPVLLLMVMGGRARAHCWREVPRLRPPLTVLTNYLIITATWRIMDSATTASSSTESSSTAST